jgi:peptide deformylase
LERHERVSIRYENAEGGVERLEAAGAFSELLQHEMDHLDGVLAVDRSLDRDSLCTREEWERRCAAPPSSEAAASGLRSIAVAPLPTRTGRARGSE